MMDTDEFDVAQLVRFASGQLQAQHGVDGELRKLRDSITAATLDAAVAAGALWLLVAARASEPARLCAARFLELCEGGAGGDAPAAVRPRAARAARAWLERETVRRVLFWDAGVFAVERLDGSRALYRDAYLEAPDAESPLPWALRSMVALFDGAFDAGASALVLGLRSGGALPLCLERNFGARVEVVVTDERAARAADAFSGWRGATRVGAVGEATYDAVFVDDDGADVEALLGRVAPGGVFVVGAAAADAPALARRCRDAGAAHVDDMREDPYDAEALGARALVVARVAGGAPPSKKRGRGDGDDEDCPLFMAAAPAGGVASHAGLAALAAIIDDDGDASPRKRRGDPEGPRAAKKRRATLGEAQVSLALL